MRFLKAKSPILGLFCFKGLCTSTFGDDPPNTTPRGRVATRAPGLKISTQEWRAGGPGGRHAGTRAPEESALALQTTRAHNGPWARYNWAARGARRKAGDNPGRQPRQGGRHEPPPTARGNHKRFAGAGDTCFPRRANKALLRGYRLELLRGAARNSTSEVEARRDPGATAPRDTRGRPRKAPDQVKG
jgi:hypothetical protein